MIRAAYWISTGIIVLVMAIGGLVQLFHPESAAAFQNLGFPPWLRIEIGLAKLIGIAAILTPGLPMRVRDWACAGFAIVLVSASLAHFNAGQGFLRTSEPLGFLLVLMVSNLTMHLRATHTSSQGPAAQILAP